MNLSGQRVVALTSLAVIAYGVYLPVGVAQQPGEQDFKALCAACHTIGGGKLVGPDLAGVSARRSEPWLLEFVQAPQAMIARGDKDAVAIFEEYSKLPMPALPLSQAQIKNVIAYIDAVGAKASGGAPVSDVAPPAATASAVEPAPPMPAAAEADVLHGRDLFQGSVRLENGGPACNSCHEAVSNAVIGGGSLAVDLTTSFSRLGAPGLQAILGGMPFPVMQAAYEQRALTANETTSLIAFLQSADAERATQTPRNYRAQLLFSGIVGALVLFGAFATIWRGRKRRSVNQAVFDRQIESTWES